MFSDKRNTLKWILIFGAFWVVTLIVWNTYQFFQIVKEEERAKMELYAEAQKTLNSSEIGADLPLVLEIFSKNTTIPLILTDMDGNIINKGNIDEEDFKKNKEKLLERFKSQNVPIIIEYDTDKYQYLYYGNSPLLVKLTYYPFALLLILFLFLALIASYFKTNKVSAQNKLWAGMAKETAHQIGTPLSSLLGWIEILRADNVDETTIVEIEKDVVRLQTIADRFSKIGSEPALEKTDVVGLTKSSYEYLKSRFSNNIEFSISLPDYPIYLMLNPILHSWTIENLIKNSIDAMKGKGKIHINIEDEPRFVKIKVEDNGKGIPKNEFKHIFDPGFTTKKRGWGLGLSLTKRIVEEYHSGNIKVLHSESGKGTTMQISWEQEK
ncbi:MAG: HAMP domain-containing sensor histidine kinase [Flavobacteriaceae bacterium]